MNLRLALSLFCILALSPACRADLVIVAPSPANHIPIAYGADGDFVVLSPDPVIYQPAGGASSQLLQLALENEFGTSAGWRFTLASALNGTLNVDNYVATMFSPHCGRVSMRTSLSSTLRPNA